MFLRLNEQEPAQKDRKLSNIFGGWSLNTVILAG